MKAVIFDMDGVICDSMYLHNSIEKDILARYGVEISTDELKKKYAGIPFIETFKKLTEGIEGINYEDIIREKKERILNEINESLKPVEGIKNLLEYCKLKNYKLGVASGSEKIFMEKVLNQLNLSEYFQVLVSSEEVENGKPSPDIFLFCAKKLEVEFRECYVVEDGVSGMEAANKAEMISIGLVEDSKNYPAKHVVKNLVEIKELI